MAFKWISHLACPMYELSFNTKAISIKEFWASWKNSPKPKPMPFIELPFSIIVKRRWLLPTRRGFVNFCPVKQKTGFRLPEPKGASRLYAEIKFLSESTSSVVSMSITRLGGWISFSSCYPIIRSNCCLKESMFSLARVSPTATL